MNWRILFLSFLLTICFATGVEAADQQDNRFRAGAAAIDISPRSLPAIMNGGFLQNQAERVVDPLYARALVLDDSSETIAMVIVDSCMIPTTLCDEIKSLVTEQTGIPGNRILIGSTHTHTAPSVMDYCLGTAADKPYLEFLPARVAQAIFKAHEKLQPAKVGWVIVDGSSFTNCRRWITRSDRIGTDPFGQKTVRAMMHPGYQNPNYTAPAGPIDPWLSILSVVSAEHEVPICLMGNLSMHYFGGPGFSADYFGEVVRKLEARIKAIKGDKADDFVGIMSQGTSGDLHWMDYSQPSRNLGRGQYSGKIAEEILRAFSKVVHRRNQTLAMAEKRLTLPRRIPSRGRREWARPKNAARGKLPPRNQVEVYAQQAEWIFENPEAEVVLQAIRVGDLGMTAIPNEVYGITGLKIKRQSPLLGTMNFELANGATGYIPPPEQHRLGGYTTWPARTAGLEEQAEPLIVETVLRLLEKVSGKRRQIVVNPETNYSKAVKNKKPIAYWRLDDMSSDSAQDTAGQLEAKYCGAVALFLPQTIQAKAPKNTWGNEGVYGNRCVYVAGGHFEASCNITGAYGTVISFWNALPVDARNVTGVLLSNGSEELLIGGKEAGEKAGRLILKMGDQTWAGSNSVATKHWQHMLFIREPERIRVYLDGRVEPEIDIPTKGFKPPRKLLIGSNGDSTTSFDGKLDEVALFDRALSGSELTDLYRATGMTAPPTPKPSVFFGPKQSDNESLQKYADAVISSKPIAYWRLHDLKKPENSDQTAKDQVGRLDAKYESGSAPFQFKSTKPNLYGGRIKARIPKLGNHYSVEFWFRNELAYDSRPVTAYLFSRAVDGSQGADGDNLGIGGTHSNAGRIIVFNGNGRNELVSGSTLLKPGSWTHVTLVREGQQVLVYLNGDKQPEIKARLPIAYPEGCQDVFLGGRADNFANLQGMLEEVALYDRALTAEEVHQHFRAAGVKSTKQDETPKTSKTKPTDVKDGLKSIHVPSGFKVELVAAEPLVQDPVAIDWGADGKLWVVEMADYPLGLDGKGKPGGRIRFLEDTNSDGRYDKSTLFATGLSFPTGIMTWGKGVLVTAAPQIVYLEDSSGDGKADIKRVLFSGFLEGNQQLRVNGLRWGLDNWVYCASGSHHGGYGKNSRILSHVRNKRFQLGSRDFRIHPDTGDFDPQSGPSQYGRNRDEWGEWFGVQNSHPLWHYVLADQNIRRNPHYAPPNPKYQVITPSNPPVFPLSKLQKRYHSFNQSGRFTSACSAMIYRDDYLFERGKDQHAFTCEPFHNLVQHNLITDDDVSFKSRRDPKESKIDFFASKDRWCRPVMARTGPDGALWIVDMYRYMIEHPEWLPPNGKDDLRPWYRSGEDRGRIYRVVREDLSPRKVPDLSRMSPQQLVAVLNSTSGWQRDMAQRLLVRKKSITANRELRELARSGDKPFGRLHALWTLDGLESLPVSLLEESLKDSHPGIRKNAIRIAARRKVDVSKLAPLVQDAYAKVRLELATTLGEYDSETASFLLAQLAEDSIENSYIYSAVMSSLNKDNVLKVLANVIQSTKTAKRSLISDLIGQTVAMGDADTIDQVIKLVFSSDNKLQLHEEIQSLAKILDSISRRQDSVGLLSDEAQSAIRSTTDQARNLVVDSNSQILLRISAIDLLGREQNSQGKDYLLLKSLLVPNIPVEIQKAVVSTLGRRDSDAVADILLDGWSSHSPGIRKQILSVLVSRKSWVQRLLPYIEANKISPSELSPTLQQKLLSLNVNSSRWQNALSQKSSTQRTVILSKFRPSLRLKGNSNAGEKIFRKNCLNCHQLGDQGFEVGPRLSSITNKSKEAIYTAILDPDSAVDAKYFNYSVATVDGRFLSGKLETETGSSITLLSEGGKRHTVLRRNIERLQSSKKSVMPVGLEKDLTQQDLADLIQFVREEIK